jgi:hypothetical protein
MRNLSILLFPVLLLFSCDENTDCNGFNLGQEFEIAVNETLENCPKNIAITLLDIQDSRCPTDADCIWAGMIVLEGTLRIADKNYPIQLSTNERISGFPEEFSTSEYTVKLIDAIPYPDSNLTSESEDKRAILVISKRST